MHQHPRAPPVTASPARSPRTNPMRTNNPRETEPSQPRSELDRGASRDQGAGISDGQEAPAQQQDINADGLAKLSQVIQNYYTKAALCILQSRVHLPPAFTKGTTNRRVNKWFNVELDETEALREDTQIWRTCDVVDNRPPPMIIDIYIDTQDLANNQSLMFHDEYGKKWDVDEVVKSYIEANTQGPLQSSPHTQVVLERWRVQLDSPLQDIPSGELGVILPRVYKNSIVLFRTLWTYTHLTPAYNLAKKLSRARSDHSIPKLKYRIYQGSRSQNTSTIDDLTVPLSEGQRDVTEDYVFESIDSPAGPFSVKMSYRPNCDFRIENSEAVLSSQFMDEDMFKPSLRPNASVRDEGQSIRSASRNIEIGSLPHTRRKMSEVADPSQAYGSLSTFHNTGPQVSSSPLSALRAAREMNARSPSESPPVKTLPDNRPAQGSRSSLRSIEGAPGTQRRTSVSFMPFKSPSLSASPSQGDQHLAASPRGSSGRSSALTALAEARNPLLQAQNLSQARGSPVLPEPLPGSSVSSSPRPTPRYSSSFGHRRARLSVGGSKTEDDNNSSGKASVTSSTAQPESGVLAEGGNASSGSVHTDDDNISDFLKLIDQKKDLKSFQSPASGSVADASTRRTTAALSKFQRLRDSNAALTESMTSSLMLHRSSSTSSRHLSSVPPMVAGTSTSISTSPGERMSPRTPHTPAIPSRLSANSIIAYNERERSAGRHRLSEGEDTGIQEQIEISPPQSRGTGAIDIPTSPRPFHPSYRRSSSVAQQHRAIALDDDLGDILPFGMRSASLGDDGTGPPLSLNPATDAAAAAIPASQHASNPTDEDVAMTRQRSTSSHEGREDDTRGSRGVPYRLRVGGRGSGRGSSTSLTGDKGTGSGSSDQRGGRYSFTRPGNFEDDEPLLFAMSDFGTGQQGRKSLEDTGRGGGEARGNRRGGSSGGGWS